MGAQAAAQNDLFQQGHWEKKDAAGQSAGFDTSYVKPVLNWANVCSPEHTSDTSANYDSFLN